MNDIPSWLGDLPTWITTLAIVLAAGQLLIERRRRHDEEDRERKAQATRLTAWAVTDASAHPRVYGTVVDNTSDSMFHDVSIFCRLHDEQVARPIELAVLPPGRYFVRHGGSGDKYTWSFPIDTGSYQGWLRPYMNSSKYQVVRTEFTDNLGQRWQTNHHAVLSLAS